MDRYDYLFKFLIIRNSGSGKTCLMSQFVEQKFRTDSTHTIGVEFGSKVIEIEGKRIKLQVWDTAGQERFRSVTRSYYRGAAGALLVYDISQRQTFNMLTNWLEDARNLASQHLCVVLIGNKKDLEERREVSFLEASHFAQDNQLIFLETSALTGENVDEAFVKCARTILQKVEDGDIELDSVSSGISCSSQMKEERRNSAKGKLDVNTVDAERQNVAARLGDFLREKSGSCTECAHK